MKLKFTDFWEILSLEKINKKELSKKPLKMGPPGSFRAIFNEHVKKKGVRFSSSICSLKIK